jgi:hypothetical protein
MTASASGMVVNAPTRRPTMQTRHETPTIAMATIGVSLVVRVEAHPVAGVHTEDESFIEDCIGALSDENYVTGEKAFLSLSGSLSL